MATLSIDLAKSGAVAAQELVNKILGLAGERGIDQATLAAQAGISAESLSRLKKAGGCRLATALELARAAGLGALELREASAYKVAASLAARKLSAGRRRPISAEALVSALASGEPQAQHRVHILGFFEELPIELVHDLILDHALDYANLLGLADQLGVEGGTVDWLAEMAGDDMADAA